MTETTKNRLGRAVKSIGWALLRLGNRLDPVEEDDGDYVNCEQCRARVDHADAVPAGDCYLCKACHEAWREEAATCEHRWGEESNEHGDPGYCCHKCGMWTDTDPLPVAGFERVGM